MSQPAFASMTNGSEDAHKGINWWAQLPALLLIFVELLWVVAWVWSVLPARLGLSVVSLFLVLGSVMLISFAFSSLANFFHLRDGVRQGVLNGLLVLSLILTVRVFMGGVDGSLIGGIFEIDPLVILVAACVVWLWWRGMTLARERLHPQAAWRRFEFGLVMLLINVFVAYAVGLPYAGLGWILLYLYVGFSAVIITRVAFHRGRQPGAKNPYASRWMAPTFLILGAILLIAGVLGGLLLKPYAIVFDWVAVLIRVMALIGLVVLLAPVLVVIMLGLFLIDRLDVVVPFVLPTMPTVDIQGPEQVTPSPEAQNFQIDMGAIAQFLPAVCFWIAVIVIIIFLFTRARQKPGPVEGDLLEYQVEPLLRRGQAKNQIKKSLEGAWNGLVGRLRSGQRLRAAARIRQIYTELEQFCAQMNLARPQGMTPFEYVQVMRKLYVNNEDDLWIVTRAYVRVRYGEYPETRDEIAQVETAWKRLSIEGRRLEQVGLERLGLVPVKHEEVERQKTV